MTQDTSSPPRSWYPIALSSQVAVGEIIPIELFGHELILFRTKSDLGLIRRFCAHMGTDLANGKVSDGCVVCPLHRWRFGTKGACADSPTNTAIAAFSVRERYGVVFAFFGEEPSFDIPSFTELSDPVYVAPYKILIDTSYLAVTLNGFDAWHFAMVHNRDLTDLREFDRTDKFHFGYSITMHVILTRWNDYLMKFLGYASSQFRLDCWGGNLLMSRNKSTGHTAFLAMTPVGSGEKTMLYFIVAEQKRGTLPTRVIQRIKLPIMQYLAFAFIKADVPIIKNMRPHKGTLLAGKDDLVLHFWDYWDDLPR